MITGLILAGGRSRRFESDKVRAVLAGRALAEHAVTRARNQVERLIISTNDPSPPAIFGAYPRLADVIGGFRGPLAGILTGLEWVADNDPDCSWLMTFSVDTPFFPEDFVARLSEGNRKQTVPVIAASGGRVHPVFGLWPVSLGPALRKFLQENEKGAVMDFFRASSGREVPFSDVPYDPFFNINYQYDIARAHEVLKQFMPVVDAADGGD